MMDIVTVSVGIGLAVSLLLTELFGLAAGGMVVPGYLALFINRPIVIVSTLIAAMATYLIVGWMSQVVIIYGKRKTALMILVGFLIGALIRAAAIGLIGEPETPSLIKASDFAVIGFIIPGLIAIWFDRQGFIETLSVMSIASVLVRLVLIVTGVEVLQ